jgi:PTH1 family peptidyl-tRNA hydrolase
LVVGLGNPGSRYEGTRHNVGFMALEAVAAAAGSAFRAQPRLQGLLADVGNGEERLRLLLPQTFMNESVVDDMDLPLGRLRLRASGSAGGHNGLRSTISHLGTQDFARLRIGIGAPADNPAERRARTIGHVLGRFSAGEQPLLQAVLSEVQAGIGLIQRQGIERAANRLNGFVPA